jgi:hypothetical protein
MASSKKYRKRSTKSGSNKRRSSSSCAGGKSRRSSSKKKNGTRKWDQKGCQSGGGSMTGGWPWGPSDVQHAGNGGGVGGVSPVPQSINGNHYSLNTATMSPPQSSNHLVEKGMFGGGSGSGSGSGRSRRGRGHGRGRRHRKFIGEQHGGMAEYLPEAVNMSLRGVAETPASVVNTLQGDPTAFVTSNPTVQPIAQPVQLK